MFTSVLRELCLSVPSSLVKLILDPAVYYAHLAGNRARAHDMANNNNDDQSSSSGGLAGGMSALTLENVAPLKELHKDIKGSMWWI